MRRTVLPQSETRKKKVLTVRDGASGNGKFSIFNFQFPISNFPLTPFLSLMERGPPSPSHGKPARSISESPVAVLPLPAGEGWGEGESVRLKHAPED